MIPRLKSTSALLLLLTGVLALLASCVESSKQGPATTGSQQEGHSALVHKIQSEPILRVRIAANLREVTVDAPLGLTIQSDRHKPQAFHSPVTIRRHGNSYVVAAAGISPVTFSGQGLWVQTSAQGMLRVDQRTYPGVLRIEHATGRYATAGHLDVINHLPMESYLPGVLHAELYRTWNPNAYAAQAIAARSYALFEMSLSHNKTYDLESTVASQAYAGAGAHDVAVQAVQQTRGVILTWEGRVLPAFYSSTCGGVNQYASLVLPHGTTAAPINSPRGDCKWCKDSTYYRWGPVAHDRVTLSRRIAAWGAATEHPIAGLGTIEQISVTDRTSAGRPTKFTLVDNNGKSFVMGAESLRFACNFTAPKMGVVPANQILRSSHCRPVVVGNRVVFEQGRGFGHGVGMCQWGAQGLAQAGYNTQSILAFYYPGSKLQRVY